MKLVGTLEICFIPFSFLLISGGLEASNILEHFGTSQYLRDLSSYLNAGMTRRRAWRRCYHAGDDGLNVSIFHSNCDSKGPTVTIVRVAGYIFGAYIDTSWKSKFIYLFIY
jgi:hypothetical protein